MSSPPWLFRHVHPYVVGTFMTAHAHGCTDCTCPLHLSPLGEQTVHFFFTVLKVNPADSTSSWCLPSLSCTSVHGGWHKLCSPPVQEPRTSFTTSQKETVHCPNPAVSDYAPPLPQTKKTLFSTVLVVLTAGNSSLACPALRQTGCLTWNRQNVPALDP